MILFILVDQWRRRWLKCQETASFHLQLCINLDRRKVSLCKSKSLRTKTKSVNFWSTKPPPQKLSRGHRCLYIVIYLFLLCLLFKVGKQCAVAFRRLLQLAVKWRLAGCSNNKVDLTRWLQAEATHVPCSSHATDLSKVLSLRALPGFFFFFFYVLRSRAHVVPSFHLSLGRNSGHAMCQLGNRGTAVQFSQPIWQSRHFVPQVMCQHFLTLLSSDLKRAKKVANLRYDKRDFSFVLFFFNLTSLVELATHGKSKNTKKDWPLWPWDALDWNLLQPAG